MLKSLLVSPVILLLTFCSNHRTASRLEEISITKKLIKNASSLDQYTEKIDFVPLETNSDSFIKEISKIIVIEDTVLIGDYKLDKIFIFKKNGHFLISINSIGRGPQEYTGISDFTYDPETRTILIMDNGSRKLIKFNLSGTYISSSAMKVDNIGTRIESTGSMLVFYRENNIGLGHPDHNIVLTDSVQTYVTSAGTIPEVISDLWLPTYKSIDITNDGIFINPLHNDTIYYCSNNTRLIKPRFKIAIEEDLDIKTSPLWEGKNDNVVFFHENAIKSGRIWDIDRFNILENGIVTFGISVLSHSHVVLYSTKTRKTRIIKSPKITPQNLFVDIIGKDRNNLIMTVRVAENFKKLEKIMKGKITQESNPVLIFTTIKPF